MYLQYLTCHLLVINIPCLFLCAKQTSRQLSPKCIVLPLKELYLFLYHDTSIYIVSIRDINIQLYIFLHGYLLTDSYMYLILHDWRNILYGLLAMCISVTTSLSRFQWSSRSNDQFPQTNGLFNSWKGKLHRSSIFEDFMMPS